MGTEISRSNRRSGIACAMVEFNRFGGERDQTLSPNNQYIRTTGYEEPAQQIQPSLSHERALDLIYRLRYPIGVTPDKVEEAQAELGRCAAAFLPAVEVVGQRLTQIDLVTNAAELWAFPFEASYATNAGWLADVDSGVVLTRRVRGGLSDQPLPWPDQPRVLFAHAPKTADLDQSLIEAHEQALRVAVEPLKRGRKEDDDLLRVVDVGSLNALANARAEFNPSYVHLLAHGAQAQTAAAGERPKPTWGLRLGYPGEAGQAPEGIARALAPQAGLPLVVTLAACDSANQTDLTFTNYSIAQELHRLGVAVVLASQFPLTKPGSVVMAGEFYRRLLQGDDVRHALHAARVKLRADPNSGNDWLSLVNYVRLPSDGYDRALAELRLRVQLGMLDAQQNRADRLSLTGGEAKEFDDVELCLRDRIATLIEGRKDLDASSLLIDESEGLLASAYKRLAELLFIRASKLQDQRAGGRAASHEALAKSADGYRARYLANMQAHWLGVQMLALEAATRGRFDSPLLLEIVRLAAEFERSNNPASFWPFGTLAECFLLAPLAGRPKQLDAATKALNDLRARAEGQAQGRFAIESTRRQLSRYVVWWTNANGFFPGTSDLSKDAAELLKTLS
jgi:CHAT domain